MPVTSLGVVNEPSSTKLDARTRGKALSGAGTHRCVELAAAAGGDGDSAGGPAASGKVKSGGCPALFTRSVLTTPSAKQATTLASTTDRIINLVGGVTRLTALVSLQPTAISCRVALCHQAARWPCRRRTARCRELAETPLLHLEDVHAERVAWRGEEQTAARRVVGCTR